MQAMRGIASSVAGRNQPGIGGSIEDGQSTFTGFGAGAVGGTLDSSPGGEVLHYISRLGKGALSETRPGNYHAR